MKKNETINREEALKKVAEVLEEALAEYEALEKMDLELAEDPSKPMMSAQPEMSDEEDEEKKKDEDEESEEDSEESPESEMESEEEPSEEDEDKEKEDEESDEALKSEYAAIMKKMEARGLVKSEKNGNLNKSENSEDLRKSIDDRFNSFASQINAIQETLAKIAGQPAARKGVSGYQPLKKTEESNAAAALSKSQVVSKLLDLRKTDRRIDTAMINRVETNRLTKSDIDFINDILA